MAATMRARGVALGGGYDAVVEVKARLCSNPAMKVP
uniref:Uncharacterized protein n=1 Tax=Arundo donax TaxID=35708 RepID=A0A0A9F1G2_ARUDO